MPVEISFERVGHFVRIPVGLADGAAGRFLVDTGIGITIVHPSLADRVGAQSAGIEQVGHRMSGQEIHIPLRRVTELDVGGLVLTDVLVGVADFGSTDGEGGFDGIIGLSICSARCH